MLYTRGNDPEQVTACGMLSCGVLRTMEATVEMEPVLSYFSMNQAALLNLYPITAHRETMVFVAHTVVSLKGIRLYEFHVKNDIFFIIL